jgi:hypothetical protein
LTATADDGVVALNWSTAANYFVKRSTTSGGGYTSIATNASLAFTNSGLTNGTLYYFVVSAGNTFGESTNSAQVSARPLLQFHFPNGYIFFNCSSYLTL